jgi:hypothetical protein
MKVVIFFISVICFLQAKAQFDFPVEVLYDSAWLYKNLKLIPVRFTGDKGNASQHQPSKFISLPEAMMQKKISVKEIITDEGSDRSVLVMKNFSDNNIVVNRGEVVSGGKQDRIIAETTIIHPGKEKQYVNVYCVEKGRWDKKPKNFQYFAPADRKLKKIMDVKKSQHELWKAIDDRYKAAGLKNDTWAYKNVSRSAAPVDTGYVRFFTRKFIESDRNFSGFIAVTDNYIIECNLYANADMQDVQFASNLAEYIEVAVTQGSVPVIDNSKVQEFIRPILADEKTRNKYLENRGRIFRQQGKIIHIVAYGE